ncbi:MAG: fumarylacetoacetate hydrolase family protein [Bdellovibrionales bacterium]|nr:fumarylacetoacetate hydrolase family protein [Bdellovibrionales bacterium]
MLSEKEILERLCVARESASPITAFTVDNPDLSVEQAYRVQRLGLQQALDGGATLAGYKMGLTSRAKQVDVNVDQAICGYLLKEFEKDPFEGVERRRYIHPRAEPELVFVMGKRVMGRPSLREVVAAVDYVCIGLELLDSRYEKFQFKLPDVIADNTSAGAYVVGRTPVKADWESLRLKGVLLRKNGKLVQTGCPAAVLGDPLQSVRQLVCQLAEWEVPLEPGQLIFTGGVTASVPFESGDWLECEWPYEKLSVGVR